MPRRIVYRRSALLLGAAVCSLSLLVQATTFATPVVDAQVPVQLPPPTAPTTPIAPPAPSASTSSLTQGVWLWVRTAYGDGSVLRSNNPNVYTVAFMSDGRVAIRADCNTGSAAYTVDGTALTIQPGVMTLAACAPDSQDSMFLRDLFQTATFAFEGAQLVLNMRVDTGNMIFSPQSATGLSGPTWRVTSYNNGMNAVVSTVSGAPLSMLFGDNGRVSGETGCNMFTGPYTLSGSSISLGPLATTRRACVSEDANRQEQAFLAALSATTRYELTGDQLTFRDNTGATQIVAVRPTVEPGAAEPEPDFLASTSPSDRS